jgi:Ca2+-dependent lipid-binding protein
MTSGHSSSQRIKGVISVTVLKANDLVKSDWLGENDCYAVISTEPLSMDEKKKGADRKNQTEIYQKTQFHYGCNPIFNEKLLFSVPEKLEAIYVQLWDADYDKDDLLAHGILNLLDDEQGGQYDTNLDKEWLHIAKISMLNEQGDYGGTLELMLHFIPETVAAYLSKTFDATQAEVKKELTQQIVGKMTNIATDKIKGYMGVGY